MSVCYVNYIHVANYQCKFDKFANKKIAKVSSDYEIRYNME